MTGSYFNAYVIAKKKRPVSSSCEEGVHAACNRREEREENVTFMCVKKRRTIFPVIDHPNGLLRPFLTAPVSNKKEKVRI